MSSRHYIVGVAVPSFLACHPSRTRFTKSSAMSQSRSASVALAYTLRVRRCQSGIARTMY